jgi:hypothetical protein
MPVTSYIPSGVHDSVLPMGKYYPSNYEKHSLHGQNESGNQEQSGNQEHSGGVASSRPPAADPRNNSDVRTKLRQYQRDMIAQATLAIGSAARYGKVVPTPAAMSLNGIPMRAEPLRGATPAKPISPKLVPLGSPGPVTPMELESSEGSYLDKGKERLSPTPGKITGGRVLGRRSPDEHLRRHGDARSPTLKATGTW